VIRDAGHSRRARAALAEMPGIDPAISVLALWCQHRDADGPTRTSGDQILYGPAFEALPFPEQTGVLAHHVLHVALRHSARAAAMAERMGSSFNARLYNLASDAIVNEVLIQGGHALPRPVVRASELLARVTGPDETERLLETWDTDRLYLALTAVTSGQSETAEGAANAYALSKTWTEDLDQGTEPDATPEIWSARLEDAFEAGRGAGNGIGPVLHQFADLPQAGIPWEVHLRRLMTRAISDLPRRSYKRPAHRWIAMESEARMSGGAAPVFQPGLTRDEKRPCLVVGLDTSSSITDPQLALFAAEAVALSRRSGAETHLLGFDTEVHTRVLMNSPDVVKRIPFRRDGGTDYADIFETARMLDPSLLVMLTDLDAPLGPDPKFPIIWAVPKPPPQRIPYGRVLRMDR